METLQSMASSAEEHSEELIWQHGTILLCPIECPSSRHGWRAAGGSASSPAQLHAQPASPARGLAVATAAADGGGGSAEASTESSEDDDPLSPGSRAHAESMYKDALSASDGETLSPSFCRHCLRTRYGRLQSRRAATRSASMHGFGFVAIQERL